MLAGVAVRLARAVIESRGGWRIGGSIVHPILSEVDGVVEIPGIHVTDGEVQLAGELWPQRFPIALHDGRKIVILLPVVEHAGIDLPGELVEDALREAIIAHRAESGLPDVPLLAGAVVRAEHVLVAVGHLHGGSDMAVRGALFGIVDLPDRT